MKKALSMILALVLILFTFGTGYAETLDSNASNPAEAAEGDAPGGDAAEGSTGEEEIVPLRREDYEPYVNRDIPQELVVGSTTQLSGFFFTDMWGNNTADLDVRALIHGYNTVSWGKIGNFQIDGTAVTEAAAADDASGNRTYTFTIAPDLTYSDGTPITARDYVFSALLISSPVLTDFGGVATTLQHLVGYENFRSGEPFSGVRLLGEYTFSLTIAAENLPYFYELALVNVNPYPMHVIAPECTVLDDGQGAYIDGPFTPELIQETVLNPDTGYLYLPQITSGPYVLTAYDKEAKVATFEKNTYYKGNYEGWVPFIEKLTYQYANPETMLEDLAQGRLDLINKVSSTEDFYAVMDMQAAGEARLITYLRSGLSFLSFACEMGVTQSANVRKAIAMCVDVQALVDAYTTPSFSSPVYGYYGLGQWMAAENQDALLELALYELNLDGANELLDQDGWIYNADGGEYNEENDAVRYRKNEAGELEELVIRYAKGQGTDLSELLEVMLTQNLSAVGIRLETTELPFAELLTHYYRQTDRTYNMFNLATNFSMIFDPYYTYSTDDMFQGVFNTTGIKDEKLMELAKNMRETEAGDNESYVEKWLEFQKYWAEVLPMVPLYSNVYADFFRPDLQNYESSAHFSWASAIVYAYLGEAVPEPELDEMLDLEGAEEAGEETANLETIG